MYFLKWEEGYVKRGFSFQASGYRNQDMEQRCLAEKSEMTGPEWLSTREAVPYPAAVRLMEERVAAISAGTAGELFWLLEHPPLYTAGTSAQAGDLLDSRFPVYETGRGGQYTYHGPGQRVLYAMLDLKKRKQDLRLYVQALESWIIQALADFDVKGERRADRIGIWVDMTRYGHPSGTEAKIAAIGVRVRKWVTFHGLAVNVHPDLSHYAGIVPCGIRTHGVTSLQDLGVQASMAEVDAALQRHFVPVFAGYGL